MGAFALRRIIGAIPLLLFVSVAVFALLQAAPGGPTAAYMRRGEASTPRTWPGWRSSSG